MNTENPNGVVTPDFFVKLPSDKEQTASEPGKSLVQEVELLRQQVQQLCAAVRGLVQLQSVANQKLDAVIKGNADVAVL
jgi:hypothetical protein